MKSELEIRRVLVVDDEPELSQILAGLVSELNLECDRAGDGIQAMELLRTNTYHAVLCDIRMPGMTGLETLAASQTEGIITPFIFVTGFGDESCMLQAMRLGAVDFISKPFENAEVGEVLTRVLEIGARRRRIRRLIECGDATFTEQIKRDERMISLMRVHNDRKRSG